MSLAIHCFATRAKMVCCNFDTFSKDEIWAIYEAVVQTNTKKVTNFGCQCLLVGRKLNCHANFQQKCKNTLDKIPKMFANWILSDIFNLLKVTFFHFYPTDLVNTKTTILLRVGEQSWIYILTLCFWVYPPLYSPPLREIIV